MLETGLREAARTFALAGGTLGVSVGDAAWPLDRLCDFAARDNPRRGFLVVSKVLGRHLPARPRDMQAAAVALAARVPADLAGPVVFFGMAETAICLGQSVHAAWRAATRREDTLYLHSTRQQLEMPAAATFVEPHSHASSHLVHAPVDPDLRALMAAARTLVIVDDEVSTGTTLRNSADALAGLLPGLRGIVTAVLTDWSDGGWLAALPARASGVALLRGLLEWHPVPRRHPGERRDPSPELREMGPGFRRDDDGRGALGRMAAHRNFGRLGIQRDPPGIAARAAALAGPVPERLLVLGTGEFTYPPFLLARALEAAGHDVVMQATTRSPAHLGGAMASALTFADNYGTGVPNYLYNARREAGRRVLICHETAPGSVDPALVAALDGECVYFG